MKFKKHGECELQFHAYWCMRNWLVGYNCTVHPEVQVPSTKHRSGSMRVDLLIAKADTPIAVIEVKTPGKSVGISRQLSAYTALRDEYGMPFFYITEYAHIDSVFAEVLSLVLKENAPVNRGVGVARSDENTAASNV